MIGVLCIAALFVSGCQPAITNNCFWFDRDALWPIWIANTGIALAYFVISGFIVLARKRYPSHVPLWVAVSFASFISTCGINHLLDVIGLYSPIYRLKAAADILTLATSAPTVIGIACIMKSKGNKPTQPMPPADAFSRTRDLLKDMGGESE